MEHRLMYTPSKEVVLIHIKTPPKNFTKQTASTLFEAVAFHENNEVLTSVVSEQSGIHARHLLMEKLKQLGYSYR